MQRVFVLDANEEPLMPCHPARARQLLKRGRAAVYRRFPFTIILLDRVGGATQPVQFKVDPGSRTSGIVLVAHFQRGPRVIWAGEIQHRGLLIRDRLLSRRQQRRARRSRKTRYRPPRFDNRRQRKGWLPPSLQSRVDNILTWLARLDRFAPLAGLSVELARFDMQKLENPEITGKAYQQGTLQGYNVREYLLEKWKRRCAYCGIENVPLQVEHIVPTKRHGSDRVSNLAIACGPCNLDKGIQTAAEYGFPEVHEQARRPLRDAAAVNTTRLALSRALEATGLPLETGTGAQTKFNRTRQGYSKTHWTDAACVGDSGAQVFIAPALVPLVITATGRGSRQLCAMDRYGFPRTGPKQVKRVHGFQTGDIVRAVVPRGKHAGVHLGRVAVRATGSFRVGSTDGISWRYCQLLHAGDGYDYT